MEAVGRPAGMAAAIDAAAPAATVVLVGGCPAGSDVTLPAAPLHYAELDVRGAFHHTPAEVDEALALLAAGRDRLARAGRARRSGSTSCTTRSCAPAPARRASSSSTRVAELTAAG